MKELYCEIESWLDAHKDGWATPEKVEVLVGAIFALRPQTILKVGIWAGRSLIPMAMALRHLKSRGKIIGIDPWEKAASAEGMEGDHLKWWTEVDHEKIFRQFTTSIVETNVGPWTQIYRCRSDQYKIPAGMVIDLLSVDGNHGEAASVYDVTHFAPLVRVGGMLSMDDVDCAKIATALLPEMGFAPLFRLDTGMFYQRIKV